ncbi:MAG: cytochrome P450, partial [Acetobacteraceae bacterium]|nr:cytochrome P450 [Acetobacteraceae bacterium]
MRAEPSLARAAFEEAVRFESPVQAFFRVTTRDVTIGGTAIPEGQKVLVFFAAANRDPLHWERPDDFWIERPA